jgi:hypothetical protein
MELSVWRRPIRLLASTAVTLLVFNGAAPASAACYQSQQQLPAQTITQFTANPAGLLSQFADGGARMISLVRDLVASDPKTLPVILDLVPRANAEQVQAIGTALGEAALVCVRPNQEFANDIQQMVVAISNETLTQSFAAVLGDQGLAAVEPGGGGGGGGPTGQNQTSGGVASNGSTPNLVTSVPNVPDHFTIFSDSGSTPGTFNTINLFNTNNSNNNAGNNHTGNSVSPSIP